MSTSPDLPRSLEPAQIALPVALARGALIALPDPRGKDTKAVEVLRFQYNPETVTRARTGQFERKLDKKAANPAQVKAEKDAARGGSLKSKSEIISFKLVFDATELMLAGGDRGEQNAKGVMPELAVLERLALGPDQIPDPPKKDNEFALITLEPTEALLLLGPRRFPGVVTQMNIVEQRFSRHLVPIRAEVDIRFRVLEVTTVAVSKDTQKAFQELLEQRKALAQDPANQFAAGSLDDAIKRAIKPRP